MRVHAFKVNKPENVPPLEEVMAQIKAEKNLKKLIKKINKTEIRAEEVDCTEGLWLIDFVKIRKSNGPGKVGRNSPVSGFDFSEGEAFGEETAALYDPNSGYLLVQFNQHGVRANAIADYLSAFIQNKINLYQLLPKYDPDVERRMRSKGIHKKVSLSLDLSKMTKEDRAKGIPLSEAIEFGRSTGSDKVKIEISVSGHKEKSLRNNVKSIIDSALNIHQGNSDAVTKLELSGKADADSMTEVLDLIAHRLSLNFEDLKLGNDLRYSRNERWKTLIRAHTGWKTTLTQ